MVLYEWSEEAIEDTIKTFKPDAERLGQDFTREDAIESLNNIVALFELLAELDQKQRKEEILELINVLNKIKIRKN